MIGTVPITLHPHEIDVLVAGLRRELIEIRADAEHELGDLAESRIHQIERAAKHFEDENPTEAPPRIRCRGR